MQDHGLDKKLNTILNEMANLLGYNAEGKEDSGLIKHLILPYLVSYLECVFIDKLFNDDSWNEFVPMDVRRPVFLIPSNNYSTIIDHISDEELCELATILSKTKEFIEIKYDVKNDYHENIIRLHSRLCDLEIVKEIRDLHKKGLESERAFVDIEILGKELWPNGINNAGSISEELSSLYFYKYKIENRKEELKDIGTKDVHLEDIDIPDDLFDCGDDEQEQDVPLGARADDVNSTAFVRPIDEIVCNGIVGEIANLDSAYSKLTGEGKEFFKCLSLAAAASELHYGVINKPSDLDVLRVDSRVLLLASLYCNPLQEYLASLFGVNPNQLKYPQSVYECCDSLKDFSVVYDAPVDIDRESMTWVDIIYSKIKEMKLSTVNGAALWRTTSGGFGFSIEKYMYYVLALDTSQQSELTIIQEFRDLNLSGNSTVKLLKYKSEIRQKLSSKVVGQNDAIESMSDEWFSSSSDRGPGPRMICTFAGPSGVGKSHMARSFCEILNEVEGTGYTFSEISMAQFDGEKDSIRLFGTGIQYGDPYSGILTTSVYFKPRHVILFDELEKAHPSVIQSLLACLDKGVEKDSTFGEDVDFSQAIFIFTSNIGQNIIENNKGGHDLSIFDLLRTGDSKSKTDSLSPEMINRLAKGSAVVFNRLSANHYIKIAKMVMEESALNLPGVNIKWQVGSESNYVKLLSPDISSRRIGAELSKITSKVLDSLSSKFSENDSEIEISINFKTDIKSTKNQTTVIIDDDDRVLDILSSAEPKFTIARSTSEAVTFILNGSPSAILVDICVMGDSIYDITLNINKLVVANSGVPIFLFEIGHEIQSKYELELQKNSHVREIFELEIDSLAVDVEKLIESVSLSIQNENEIKQLIRLNQKVNYTWETIGKNPYIVEISLGNPVQVISAADTSHSMFGREIPKERMSDVIGLKRAKDRIMQVIDYLKNPELFNSSSIRPPTGYLIAGEPGTGKTMLAKAVAGESGMPFFTLSVSDIASSSDGGPITKIKDMFAMARKYAPSIIFLDEIDSFGAKRTKSSNPVIVNSLLTEMDGFTKSEMPVFVLAATNYPEILDDALVRAGRFDEIIYCDYPNLDSRIQLFNKLFDKSKSEINLKQEDMQLLASVTVGMSAAQIDQIYRETVYWQRAKTGVVDYKVVQEIISKVRYGNPSDTIELSRQTKWETAYHESGHLILQMALLPNKRIDYITIEPRDRALGFVASSVEEQYSSLTLKDIKNHVSVLLAGREAEKLFAGSLDGVSLGASSDLSKATSLLYRAICECGLGEGLPPINTQVAKQYIDSKFSDYEQTIKSIILECEDITARVLMNNLDTHERFTKYLYEKESLIHSEISDFFKGVNVHGATA